MQVSLEPYRLAEDWYKVNLAKNKQACHIFINVKQQIFSVAPVLNLNQLQQTLVSQTLSNPSTLNSQV